MTRPHRAGFTLIEVLLAIGLAAVVLGGVMSFAWNLADRRDAVQRASRDGRAGDALIERLERDLLAAVVGDPVRGAGVRGDGHRLKVLSRGVVLALPAESPPGEGTSGPGAEGDLQGSEYLFDAGGGGVRARRWEVRDDAGVAGVSGGAGWEEVSGRVKRLRFRYHDGRAWRSSFDSLAEERLPGAVEVAIWFGESTLERGVGGRDEGDKLQDTLVSDEPATGAGDDRAGFSETAGGALASPTTEPPHPDEAGMPDGPPDRLRVILVPDAPPPEEDSP